MVAAMCVVAIAMFVASNYYLADVKYVGFATSQITILLSTAFVTSILMRASAEGKIAILLSALGKKSLDIYVLHYIFYFVDFNRVLPRDMLQGAPLLLQFLILSGCACALIACSWVLSKVIRSNKYLTILMLGR